MGPLTPLVLLALGLAYSFDFLNGFHDAPNAISTVVATRVLSPAAAISLSALFNLVAFMVFGLAVAATVGEGIVRPADIDVDVILSALVSAIAFGAASWRLELPTSSSHALIGGLVGGAVAQSGLGSVEVSGLALVLAFMVLSPVLGFVGASGVMGVAVRAFGGRASRDVYGMFGKLQVASSSMVSLAHGANDGQKTMGIVTALLVASGNLSTFAVPLWVIISAQAAIAGGTLLGGWGVVRTIGFRLAGMDRVRGVSTEASAAVVIGACSLAGIPVSTTQCVSGAVMGATTATPGSRVRWNIARGIGMAWLMTIPLTAAAAWATYHLVSVV